ncbi:uncharacterized protein M421DRAFT_174268 [Didymella exigua CBS 183.55]|uniref:Uncharacterized protein n=1 Tax=Didymella exigua CBS 183.55 TaxID=1150837 RepID=A0A6A5RKV0_9PLEO|nr:uncharacterized protein M421DRAFT_174268 [Didymella exigua CBS 183.55]KAF1927738.1 hypothetical protein M421DRAFT_174268 [Didymella exigua CBS 183.55]
MRFARVSLTFRSSIASSYLHTMKNARRPSISTEKPQKGLDHLQDSTKDISAKEAESKLRGYQQLMLDRLHNQLAALRDSLQKPLADFLGNRAKLAASLRALPGTRKKQRKYDPILMKNGYKHD